MIFQFQSKFNDVANSMCIITMEEWNLHAFPIRRYKWNQFRQLPIFVYFQNKSIFWKMQDYLGEKFERQQIWNRLFVFFIYTSHLRERDILHWSIIQTKYEYRIDVDIGKILNFHSIKNNQTTLLQILHKCTYTNLLQSINNDLQVQIKRCVLFLKF